MGFLKGSLISGNLPLTASFLPITVFFFIYTFIITPYLFGPLSEIPNAHWSAPLSSLWILNLRRKQRETFAVHAAHQRLGPVIRLGPNEISVNSVEGGIRTVYAGGYEKGDWYKNVFSNYGTMPMFAMPEHGMHSKRKRMMSNIYAKSTLQQSTSLRVASKVLLQERLLPRLEKLSETGDPVDWYEVVSAVTMDFVNAYIFGLKNGSDFLREPEKCSAFLKSYKDRQTYTFWPQELRGLTSFLQRIGLAWILVPKWVDEANAGIEKWVLEMCDNAERTLNAIEEGDEDESSTKAGNYPTVYAQMRGALLKEHSKSLDDSTLQLPVGETVRRQRLEIASEMLDHSMAGFDTSGITITYLTWELSRPHNKRWQDKLRDEITGLDTPTPTPKAIDSLPILNAILMETLRLHAAIPGNQPRVTPAKATLGGSPYFPAEIAAARIKHTIAPIYPDLPANVRVNAQAWSLHRNPHVFTEPEVWNPARWLPDSSPDGESSDEQLKEMSRWFWAFGSGGRMCVGSNLAMQEIKAVICLVWGPQGFETKVVGDAGMGHNGGYLAEPLGDENGKAVMLSLRKVGGVGG
ncbi:cytochrome P450 [Polychaeton citri CBS 116435]|uniref:Cytochrome P450 n=1 Tax=Polychaeton citri CBS 116435 TaxID=1314669 RepID=A0A9P4ULP7_9PEZI|nr:cytochrome P450 [Polychaeton citri CBS 116435]